LFYSAAYKTLFNIWEFRKKGDVSSLSIKNTDYINFDDDKRDILNNFFENNKSNEFNKWFNDELEKNFFERLNLCKKYKLFIALLNY